MTILQIMFFVAMLPGDFMKHGLQVNKRLQDIGVEVLRCRPAVTLGNDLDRPAIRNSSGS
jgi:hypothetical protein